MNNTTTASRTTPTQTLARALAAAGIGAALLAPAAVARADAALPQITAGWGAGCSTIQVTSTGDPTLKIRVRWYGVANGTDLGSADVPVGTPFTKKVDRAKVAGFSYRVVDADGREVTPLQEAAAACVSVTGPQLTAAPDCGKVRVAADFLSNYYQGVVRFRRADGSYADATASASASAIVPADPAGEKNFERLVTGDVELPAGAWVAEAGFQFNGTWYPKAFAPVASLPSTDPACVKPTEPTTPAPSPTGPTTTPTDPTTPAPTSPAPTSPATPAPTSPVTPAPTSPATPATTMPVSTTPAAPAPVSTTPATPAPAPTAPTRPTTPAPTPATPAPTKPTVPTVPTAPAKPRPITAPGHHARTVTLTVQVDRYRRPTAATAATVGRLAADGRLGYREDRALWGHSRWEFVTVTVPAGASRAQVLAAVNAKTHLGTLASTSTVAPAGRGDVVMAWLLGRGATPAAPWGRTHAVAQTYLGCSA